MSLSTDLNILPAWANAQTDSWNTGILEKNIASPVINNVVVSLPGWSSIPNPGGFTCQESSVKIPCAIAALPSPSNPIPTPANLGFGTATGVALEGVGASAYQTSSVVNALTVSGGLVGLDLKQFQGAYIATSKFASDVYGVRADTAGSGSTNLSVSNTLFTETVAGIYSNGVSGTEIEGNYITAGDGAATNLPAWAAIWDRNPKQLTVSSNNVLGAGNAARPQYGIFLSSDAPNSAPASLSGNTVYNLTSSGSVCIGNDLNTTMINASGNSMTSCTTNVSDPTNDNAYANNTLTYPDEYDDGNRDVQFPKSVTIGSGSTAGSLQIITDGVQKLLADSSGDLTASGSVTAGGSVIAAGALTGSSVTSNSSFVMTGSSSHNGAEEVVGNWIVGAGTLTLSAPSGAFPAVTNGLVTLFGELSCSNPGAVVTWHIIGHYISSNGALQTKAFAATVENDGDSVWLNGILTGANKITPQLNPKSVGLQVVFGPGTNALYDCTATLNQMVND